MQVQSASIPPSHLACSAPHGAELCPLLLRATCAILPPGPTAPAVDPGKHAQLPGRAAFHPLGLPQVAKWMTGDLELEPHIVGHPHATCCQQRWEEEELLNNTCMAAAAAGTAPLGSFMHSLGPGWCHRWAQAGAGMSQPHAVCCRHSYRPDAVSQPDATCGPYSAHLNYGNETC